MNVQTAALATEQLAAAVSQITRHVSHSTAMVTQARHDVHHADTPSPNLAETTQRIAQLVALIEAIADQTALLVSEVNGLARQTTAGIDAGDGAIAAIHGVTGQTLVSLLETIPEINRISESVASGDHRVAAIRAADMMTA